MPRMRPPAGRFRLQLLPPDSPLGWTPYAWLLYLLAFLVEPVIRTGLGRASALYWAATLLGVAVFLVVYFRGFWLRGRDRLPVVAAQVLLGVVFAPLNMGAGVFFIYASAAAGYMEPRRHAGLAVAAIAVIATTAGWLAPTPAFYWVPVTAVAVLIGGVSIHEADAGRAQARLRLAHAEIEHLAAVAERERIARDLHDVLGHTLSLIVLKAELASRLAVRDPARAAGEMRDVEEVARRTLQEVRETIRGYRATLAEEALRAAAMLKAAAIDAQIATDGVVLPRAVEETLALALREAITNVVRHSRASRCSVHVEQRGAEVALTISDDGRGGSLQEGSGMRGMRERVEAFGGRVDVDSPHGLRVRVLVPLLQQAQQDSMVAEAG